MQDFTCVADRDCREAVTRLPAVTERFGNIETSRRDGGPFYVANAVHQERIRVLESLSQEKSTRIAFEQLQKLLKVVWGYVDRLMSSTVDFHIRRLPENWREIRC
jgi:uncharacterized protein (DUF2342 family)